MVLEDKGRRDKGNHHDYQDPDQSQNQQLRGFHPKFEPSVVVCDAAEQIHGFQPRVLRIYFPQRWRTA